jgi:hypothetical protein
MLEHFYTSALVNLVPLKPVKRSIPTRHSGVRGCHHGHVHYLVDWVRDWR